jgi:gas vesicle protein
VGREDREVVLVDRSEGGALKWLVVGAALGAGIALLFAPKAGKDLRRDLKKGIRRARELADDTIHEFRREREGGGDTTEERAVPAGAYVDEEDEDGEDEEPAPAERPPRPSLVSAREELERRLAAARARRQAVAPEEEEPVA